MTSQNRLLVTALRYAEFGWRVFPLRVRAKEPIDPCDECLEALPARDKDGNKTCRACGVVYGPEQKRGFHQATTDAALITKWWTKYPQANVGIATGAASGLWVLDVDVKEQDGLATLAALCAPHPAMPVTPEQTTGFGTHGVGRQILFAYTEPLRNSKAGFLGPGLDTRGDGGYIVAPPSVHPSGRAYAWREDRRPSQVPLAPAPEWLLAKLRPAPPRPRAPVERPDRVPHAYGDSALQGEFDKVAGTTKGGRNGALNDAAFNLGQLIACGAVSRGAAEQALERAAEANGYTAEHGAAHVAAVIRSGLEAGIANLRDIQPRERPPERTARPVAAAKPQLRVVAQQAPEPAVAGPVGAPALSPVDLLEPWRSLLVCGSDGRPLRGSMANAQVFLRHLPESKGLFRFDDFRAQTIVTRRPPWTLNGFTPGALTNSDVAGCAAWLERQGVSLRTGAVREAIEYVATQDHVNPVRDFLDGLAWDGVERLDHWLQDFLGVADSSFVRQAGSKWLIGAVARVFQPGCKVDTMLILEGPQGLKKSTALEAIGTFGGGRWFTDDLGAVGSKDAVMQIQGNLIVEFSDLDGMSRADVDTIKAFLSRRIDKVRLPYGHVVSTMPRQCVFAGTVNPGGAGYLRDPTGGRRFWPVTCTAIDLDALASTTDKLWAEAVARYRSGEAWWLTDADVLAEAASEQEARREEDPLVGKLADWVRRETILELSTRRVLEDCWGFPAHQITSAASRRAASALRELGWEPQRDWDAKRRGQRVYRPVDS